MVLSLLMVSRSLSAFQFPTKLTMFSIFKMSYSHVIRIQHILYTSSQTFALSTRQTERKRCHTICKLQLELKLVLILTNARLSSAQFSSHNNYTNTQPSMIMIQQQRFSIAIMIYVKSMDFHIQKKWKTRKIKRIYETLKSSNRYANYNWILLWINMLHALYLMYTHSTARKMSLFFFYALSISLCM